MSVRRRFAFLAAGTLLVGSPAYAATSLWGYSGLATMPDAETAPMRDLEVGARWMLLPESPVAIAGFARYGVFDGLEASLLYGVPGYAYLTGSLKYQLMHPTPANPTSVAIGATLLGVPAGGPIAGTEYFLSVSRDLSVAQHGRTLPVGTLHLGFEGDAAFNARLMVGLSVPLGRSGQVMIEGRGPQASAQPFGHLGFELTPLPWIRLDAATLGSPDRSLWDRGLYAGASAHGLLPDFMHWFEAPPSRAPAHAPAQAPRPASSVPPANPPASGSTVSPPALPAATLVGRVLGADGSPQAGLRVRLRRSGAEATTTASGYFFFPALGPGRYTIEIADPSGKTVAEQDVEVTSGGPVSVTIQLGERSSEAPAQRGGIVGEVLDARGARPLPGARVAIEGTGLSVVTTSDSEGRFKTFDLLPGSYRVKASYAGYQPRTRRVQVGPRSWTPQLTLDLAKGS